MSSSGDAAEASPPPANTRRERGKLAQRAYRKRHASKFQTLQEENKRLRDAIQSVSEVAVHDARSRRWPELNTALNRARELAGLDPSCAEVEADDHMDSDDAPISFVLPGPSNGVINLPRSQLYPLGLPRPSATTNNPQLGHGTWLDVDPLLDVSDPPSDIVKYLGEGLGTLASCLYWACTSHTVKLWQESGDSSQSDALPTNLTFDSIFSHSDHLRDRGFLMGLAKARLDFRTKGYVSLRASDHKELEYPPGFELKVKEDHARQGGNIDWWKTPQQVEAYVKQRLQPGEMERLQAGIENRACKTDQQALLSFLWSLRQNYKCFGDGPRWNAMFASLATGIYIKKLRGDDI